MPIRPRLSATIEPESPGGEKTPDLNASSMAYGDAGGVAVLYD